MWSFFILAKFWSHLSQYPSGQKVQHTARKVHNMLGEQLADGLCSKSYSKWG